MRRECGKIPKQCIFCKKKKYLRNTKTRKSCCQFSADTKKRKASELREDREILAVATD